MNVNTNTCVIDFGEHQASFEIISPESQSGFLEIGFYPTDVVGQLLHKAYKEKAEFMVDGQSAKLIVLVETQDRFGLSVNVGFQRARDKELIPKG